MLLTLATGYFVAQEFAYVSVDRNRLRQLADEGDAAAARALDITARLSFTLSGAQFGITVTALLVGYVGRAPHRGGLADLLGLADLPYAARLTIAVALVLLFATVLQMVVGELAPKNLAIARPIPLARSLSRSTLIYLTVAGPLIRLFDAASNRLLRRGRHRTGRGALARCDHRATWSTSSTSPARAARSTRTSPSCSSAGWRSGRSARSRR